jgi:hypothetical protein
MCHIRQVDGFMLVKRIGWSSLYVGREDLIADDDYRDASSK